MFCRPVFISILLSFFGGLASEAKATGKSAATASKASSKQVAKAKASSEKPVATPQPSAVEESGTDFVSAVIQGRPILDFPWDAREKNTVRLSNRSCDECSTMDAFYEKNPYVFVLFYERVLTSGYNHYKQAIIEGFHKVCSDLRWSYIACGMVDMVEDRPYGERYIDPKTAPAHIIVQRGQPVQLTKEHVQQLMSKPGDVEIMRSHLENVLSPSDPGAILISSGLQPSGSSAMSVKALRKKLEQHAVVVVGAAKGAKERETLRAAAQRLVSTGKVSHYVQLPGKAPKSNPPKKVKEQQRWLKARLQRRMLFLAVQDPKLKRELHLDEGQIVVYVRGSQAPNSDRVATADARNETTVADALLRVALPAIDAVEKTKEEL